MLRFIARRAAIPRLSAAYLVIPRVAVLLIGEDLLYRLPFATGARNRRLLPDPASARGIIRPPEPVSRQDHDQPGPAREPAAPHLGPRVGRRCRSLVVAVPVRPPVVRGNVARASCHRSKEQTSELQS